MLYHGQCFYKLLPSKITGHEKDNWVKLSHVATMYGYNTY